MTINVAVLPSLLPDRRRPENPSRVYRRPLERRPRHCGGRDGGAGAMGRLSQLSDQIFNFVEGHFLTKRNSNAKWRDVGLRRVFYGIAFSSGQRSIVLIFLQSIHTTILCTTYSSTKEI